VKKKTQRKQPWWKGESEKKHKESNLGGREKVKKNAKKTTLVEGCGKQKCEKKDHELFKKTLVAINKSPITHT